MIDSVSSATFDRFARFYDADYRHYQDDLDLILDLADQTGGAILELGCGTGRVLLPLLKADHTVTGIDISPALLELAAKKTRITHHASRITLHEADLRTFDLPTKNFAFAFCTSNTLMHLTTQADQLAVLRNAYRHLRPGGLLLIDLFNPDVARLHAVNGLMELADQWDDPATGAQVIKWSVRTVDWSRSRIRSLFMKSSLPIAPSAAPPVSFPSAFSGAVKRNYSCRAPALPLKKSGVILTAPFTAQAATT
ncbi:MAG: class I SAM-dependent methyltransferase [Caldilineaceae bacterium]